MSPIILRKSQKQNIISLENTNHQTDSNSVVVKSKSSNNKRTTWANDLVESCPEQSITSQSDDLVTSPPLHFHQVKGALVKICDDQRLTAIATGSDVSLGCLSFLFFDRPIQPWEEVSIRVSMRGQKSIFLIAGLTNENPSRTRNMPKIFSASCSLAIRSTTSNKSMVTFWANDGGRMEAEIDGKAVYSEQSFRSLKHDVDPKVPMWAFVRLFHKNDQVDIILR